MTTAIRVEVARAVDARDVAEALGAHGLPATLVDVDGGWEVEVGCADGDAEVVAEVSHALDDWVVERGIPFVATQVGARRLTVRPPCA